MLTAPRKGFIMNLKNGVKVSKRLITPVEAQIILDTKLGANRKMKLHYAESMADAWDRGEYIQTGDTLKYDRNGQLIDGQHRLMAVVLSGQITEFVVVEGIDPDAIRVIDAELAKRSLADQLGIIGFKNTAALATVVRASWAMEQNGKPQLSGHGGLTMAQAIDFIERRSTIEASAVAGRKFAQRTSGITAREFGALFDIMHHTEPGVADNFFDQVSNEYGDKGSPAVRLVSRTKAHEAQEQHSVRHVMGLFIKAWNAEVEGRKPRSLKMDRDEPFPAINDFDKWLAAGGVQN